MGKTRAFLEGIQTERARCVDLFRKGIRHDHDGGDCGVCGFSRLAIKEILSGDGAGSEGEK